MKQHYTEQMLEELTAHPLHDVFLNAIHQAIYGKGERHGGAEHRS